MKLHIITHSFLLLLLISCESQQENGNIPIKEAEPTTYSGPIIDMHIHTYQDGDPMLGMTHPPTLRNETYNGATSAEEHKNLTLAKFQEHNIVKAMATDAHGWVEEAPGVILIGSAHGGVDELKKQYEEGKLHAIAEMAPFYAGKLANDPSQIPYFELATELDIPVGFHILPGGPNAGIHLMPEMLGGMRAYNASPLQLEDILVKYPDLRIYIMHGGWPYLDDVKALLYAHPNLYIDIAVINWILPQEEFNTYIRSLINAGFGDRIMYGSDQMVWPQVISIGIESVNNIDHLTLDQKEDIFFDNAARFLQLGEEEITKLKNP